MQFPECIGQIRCHCLHGCCGTLVLDVSVESPVVHKQPAARLYLLFVSRSGGGKEALKGIVSR
eukprot:7054260-Lingulodinium_polyedra.AAC.1